jgi:hypothetical protein
MSCVDSICASCAGSDDNCDEDYVCSDTVCIPDESMITGAIIAICVASFFIVLAASLGMWYCCKAKEGQAKTDGVMHEALT